MVAAGSRVDLLIIVAGVSGAGKSHFIQDLVSPPNAALRRRFFIAPDSAPFVVQASDIDALPAGGHRCVAFHYDITRLISRRIASYAHDPSLKIINLARAIIAVTIACKPEELRRRMTMRFPTQQFVNLHDWYGNRAFLTDWHKSWFSHLDAVIPTAEFRYMLSGDGYPDLGGRPAVLSMVTV